jgi:hypothetical protein
LREASTYRSCLPPAPFLPDLLSVLRCSEPSLVLKEMLATGHGLTSELSSCRDGSADREFSLL